jgi:protein subunit release factor B
MKADGCDYSVMNTFYPTDRESLERDCDVEFFIASGPGGQHRNKVETGVRLIHRPSGTRVTATERRSQQENRERAFERMATRLQEQQRVVPVRKPTRPTAASRLRRLEQKRRRSLLKKQRSSSPGE